MYPDTGIIIDNILEQVAKTCQLCFGEELHLQFYEQTTMFKQPNIIFYA